MKNLLLQLNRRSLLIVALVFALAATGWSGQRQSTKPAHHAPGHIQVKKNRRLPATRTHPIGRSQKSFKPLSFSRRHRTQSIIGAITLNTTAGEVAVDPTTSPSTTDGNISLRSAIQYTNAMIRPDIIVVPAGTYQLTLAGADEDVCATGDLDINDSLVIIGAGEGKTVVNGRNLDNYLQNKEHSQ